LPNSQLLCIELEDSFFESNLEEFISDLYNSRKQ